MVSPTSRTFQSVFLVTPRSVRDTCTYAQHCTHDRCRAPASRRHLSRMEAVGAVRVRAGVGHGARGLQRGRRRRGSPSRTTTPARAPTAGTRTGSAASATTDQTLCFAFAFWNGRDPILKERIFGLTGHEGNHGEDAKEYWWYLDSTPTHSWMRWRYCYPQAEFPYDDSSTRTAAAAAIEPEYELLDTGVFDDDRYWDITVDYAKADARRHLHPPDRPQRRARRGDARTCCRRCGSATRGRGASTTARPRIDGRGRRASSPSTTRSGAMTLVGRRRAASCCSATTRPTPRGCGASTAPPLPEGRHQRPRRARRATPSTPTASGTKAALWYRARGRGRATTAEIRLRLGAGRAATSTRRGRATPGRPRAPRPTTFYAALTPAAAHADEALVMRQAFAGMLWSKQFYHYDVDALARRRPGRPAAAGRAPAGATRRGGTSTTTT